MSHSKGLPVFSVLILFATLASGYLLRRLLPPVRGESLSLWLNRYVIYVALPALVLLYIPRIDLDASVWTPVLSAWGLFLLTTHHDLAAHISVFEADMAPMVSSATMAILANLNRQFVASVLGYGIVLSFGTLPVVYWVVQHLLDGL